MYNKIMLNKNLVRLEFNKILENLEKYCVSSVGKSLAISLEPSNNIFTVKETLSETSLALELLLRKGDAPINDFSNIDIYIKNLKSNNTISAKALLDVAKVLEISRNLKEYFYNDASFDLSNFTLLDNIFNKLYSNDSIEKRIFASIIDEDSIADDASKALSSLRRTRRNLEQGVRNKLSDFIHSSTYSKYLMDSIITIRDDRFVIPVKEEYKDKISGSILDFSASGSTVYIEPSSVYELNNKINNLKAEELIEIEKILKALSLLLFPIASNLSSNIKLIGKLDFIFAKARYSRFIDGSSPSINENKFLNFISARHPLIEPSKVVPIDVSIGNKYSTLLITGPNTGGKTATLKTVGLLTAMACAGLHIPAKEGSSIYVFDNIFADIGDEQSIQESLSTFSSHILNIIDILKFASTDSLILLDELGSGTDPVEGSSLAISILKYLHSLGSLTMVTTHYPELKQYALITDGFENASSDFDIEHLKPTYNLLIGVPGKSNAFEISKTLGLPNEIIDDAQKAIKSEHINIETLLKNIYDDKLEIEKEKENIQKNSNQIELLRKSLERDNSQLNKEAEKIVENAKIKAKELLLDAKDEANEIIKELNSENISLSDANKLRNKLNSSLDSLNDADSGTVNSNKLLNKTLEPTSIFIGQNVFVKKLKQDATIISLPNKANEVQVQVGIIKMNINIEELAPSNKKVQNKDDISSAKTLSKFSFDNNLKSQNISSELNVIGLNVDQAVPIVDKYLDDAYISGLEFVRIVHGKGTGKLREGIQAFLKHNPHVKSFRIGTFGEGEMGVTIVYLMPK